MELNTEDWKEFRIGDLFEGHSGDFDIKQKHINGKGTPVITSGLNNTGLLGKTDVKAKIFPANTITIDMFGNAFLRDYEYKLVTHARVFCLKPKREIPDKALLFITTTLFFLKEKYDYSNMCSFKKIKNKEIFLPEAENNEPDFAFMEEYLSLIHI